VLDLPRPDFSLKFTPSPTTLFRFSALTFNGHRIHLDRDYARESEGYPGKFIAIVSESQIALYTERLVHGPLTALMLLETLAHHHPEAQVKSFEYRALNPVVVGEVLTFNGTWNGSKEVVLWVQNEAGMVGMKGKVLLECSQRSLR
jgi:hydroxyacyl-ACP dehydratase HTD2-like protein with hotdog domain